MQASVGGVPRGSQGAVLPCSVMEVWPCCCGRRCPAQVVGQVDEDQDLRALSAPLSQGEEAEGPLS